MKIKYILIAITLLVFFEINSMQAYAISEKAENKTDDINVEQMINLEWWKSFDDDYLTEYIIKGIQNNQDLKIATLKVEEARQNVKLQFANELPYFKQELHRL